MNILYKNNFFQQLKKQPLIFLLILSFAIPFINIGKPKLGSTYEARVVVTGENMVRRADWIVPYFNGGIRLQKPPLPYWCIAGLYLVFGHLRESIFRLPSAIMGVVGVILLLFMAKMMFGWETAVISALIQALTFKYIIESRGAQVDIYLVFWITASLFVLTTIFFGSKRRDWLWIILGIAMALAFLSKWINIFVFILPPMIYGFKLFPKRRPKPRFFILFILIFFTLGFSWIALLINNLGWQTVYTSWVHEAGNNIISIHNRHQYQFYYYILQLFAMTAPWSVIIPAGIAFVLWTPVKQDKIPLKWISLSIALFIIALSCASKKKMNYLLPALPFMAISAGRFCVISLKLKDSPLSKPIKWIFGLQTLALFIGAAATAFVLKTETNIYSKITLFFVLILLCGSFAYSLHGVIKNKLNSALYIFFTATVIFSLVLFGIFMPGQKQVSSDEFADQIKQAVGDAPVWQLYGCDKTLVYHLQRPVTGLWSVNAIKKLLEQYPEIYVLVSSKHLNSAKKLPHTVVLYDPNYRNNSIPIPGIGGKSRKMYLIKYTRNSIEK